MKQGVPCGSTGQPSCPAGALMWAARPPARLPARHVHLLNKITAMLMLIQMPT